MVTAKKQPAKRTSKLRKLRTVDKRKGNKDGGFPLSVVSQSLMFAYCREFRAEEPHPEIFQSEDHVDNILRQLTSSADLAVASQISKTFYNRTLAAVKATVSRTASAVVAKGRSVVFNIDVLGQAVPVHQAETRFWPAAPVDQGDFNSWWEVLRFMEQFHFQNGSWQTRPFCDIYSHTAQWDPPKPTEHIDSWELCRREQRDQKTVAKLPVTPLAGRKKLIRPRFMKTSLGHITVAGHEVAACG